MYDQMNDDDSENIEILIRKSGIRRSHFNNPNVKKNFFSTIKNFVDHKEEVSSSPSWQTSKPNFQKRRDTNVVLGKANSRERLRSAVNELDERDLELLTLQIKETLSGIADELAGDDDINSPLDDIIWNDWSESDNEESNDDYNEYESSDSNSIEKLDVEIDQLLEASMEKLNITQLDTQDPKKKQGRELKRRNKEEGDVSIYQNNNNKQQLSESRRRAITQPVNSDMKAKANLASNNQGQGRGRPPQQQMVTQVSPQIPPQGSQLPPVQMRRQQTLPIFPMRGPPISHFFNQIQYTPQTLSSPQVLYNDMYILLSQISTTLLRLQLLLNHINQSINQTYISSRKEKETSNQPPTKESLHQHQCLTLILKQSKLQMEQLKLIIPTKETFDQSNSTSLLQLLKDTDDQSINCCNLLNSMTLPGSTSHHNILKDLKITTDILQLLTFKLLHFNIKLTF